MVLAAKVEGDLDCAVFAAVIDDEDLVARRTLVFFGRIVFLGGFAEYLTVAVSRWAAQTLAFLDVVGSILSGGTAEALVEVLNGLLQSGYYALLFVIGRDHDGNFDFGGLDVASVGNVEGIVLAGSLGFAQLALGVPAVVPAGQRTWVAHSAVDGGGDVGLLGGEGSSRLGGDKVKDCVETDIGLSEAAN